MAAHRVALAVATVLLVGAAPSQAASFAVDTTADGAEPCAATGPCTLRGAIQAANALEGPDVVTIPAAAEPYRLTIAGAREDLNATGDLDVTDSLSIEGAGAIGVVIDANGLDGVIQGVSETATLDVSGVTIRGGAPSSAEATPALSNRGPRLTLTDATVRDNASGTAISGFSDAEAGSDLTLTRVLVTANTSESEVIAHGPRTDGTLRIEDSQILDNTSAGELVDANPAGGTTTEVSILGTTIAGNDMDDYGVDVNPSGDVASATLTIERSTFRDNHLVDSEGLVDFDPSSRGPLRAILRISDSVFEGTRADAGIGALLIDPCSGAAGPNDVDVRIERSRFEANVTGGPGQRATPAAIVYSPCRPEGGTQSFVMTDSVVVGNEARGEAAEAGAVALDGPTEGTATITGTTFARNVGGTEGSSSIGGALAIDSLDARIVNSTFDGNAVGGAGQTTAGAAIIVNEGTLDLVHTTLSENTVTGPGPDGPDRVVDQGAGGALWAYRAAITVTGSLFTGNVAFGAARDCGTAAPEQAATVTSGGSNIEAGTSCGLTGAGDRQGIADPALAPLAGNGGPSPTRAPVEGSPAVDAAAAATCPAVDQRGVARPQGAGCDVGAVELTAAPPPPPPPPPPGPDPGAGPGAVPDPGPGPFVPPPIVTEPPDPLLLSCARKRLALVDVVRAGRRVRITGQAARALAGQRVRLFVSDRRNRRIEAGRAGRATVRADGTFTATLPRPPRRLRSPQYFARAETGAPSSPLELDRRMYADSLRLRAGRITLRGHITRPLPRRRGGRVTIVIQTDCRTREVAARARLDRRGRFTASFAAPAGVPEILVRARTNVPTRRGGPAKFRTFTLPRPLKLR